MKENSGGLTHIGDLVEAVEAGGDGHTSGDEL